MLKERAKILIIEDSKNVRKSYGELLTHEGYNVLEARQREEALEMLTPHPHPRKKGISKYRLSIIHSLFLLGLLS